MSEIVPGRVDPHMAIKALFILRLCYFLGLWSFLLQKWEKNRGSCVRSFCGGSWKWHMPTLLSLIGHIATTTNNY